MTEKEALAKFDTKWWESATDDEIVKFQLFEPLLCMPFGRFHEAVEKRLSRPVYTHEFATSYIGKLREEFKRTA